MSIGHHYAHVLANNLTQLYTETKKSALSNVQKEGRDDAAPELNSLHRKFRIQKDRLITWGLEWSDEGKGPDGNIDGSVARAGLTDTVTSVLENIKEVLQQAERIRSDSLPPQQSWPPLTPEKVSGIAKDINRYRDLVTDLSTSVDILYDLSRNRRALIAGSHPSFTSDSTKLDQSVASLTGPSVGGSELTLVNPAGRFSSSRYTDAPARIDISALILPEEGPPPYQNAGIPLTTRMIGRLLRSQAPDEIRFFLQESLDDPLVLIEYANPNSAIASAVPTRRLSALAGYLQQARSRSALNLLGYFEDPQTNRLGLVYDIGDCVLRTTPEADLGSSPIATHSLLHVLQTASKSAKNHETLSATPALEERFRLASSVSELAKEMHNTYFAHGGISSDGILFIRGEDAENKSQMANLQNPVLSAFEVFVRSDSDSTLSGIQNIYRHPEDSSSSLDVESRIRFEMYGLGVVLLEIGLWTPLSDLFKAKYQLRDFKTRLERIWIPRLAVKCGSLYMSAVQECFRFSDDIIEDPSEAIQLYDGILSKLRRCCLLCDDTAAEATASPMRATSPPDISPLHVKTTNVEEKRRSTDSTQSTKLQSWIGRPNSFREYRRKVIVIQQCWRALLSRRKDSNTQDSPTRSRTTSDPTKDAQDLEPAQPKQRMFPVQLPTAALDAWHSELGLNLSRIVERALKNSLESATIDLVGLGTDEASARPTVLVTCTSTAKVKAAIKKRFACPTNMFDVKVRKGSVNLSKKSCKGELQRSSAGHDQRVFRSNTKTTSDSEDDDADEADDGDGNAVPAQNPYYHPRPSSGASIGAYHADEGHLPPVTFGGYVTVDGETYGMSVHHMLEPGSDSEPDDDSEDDSDDADDESSESADDDEDNSTDDDDGERMSTAGDHFSLSAPRERVPRSSARLDQAVRPRHQAGLYPLNVHRDDEAYTSSSDIDFLSQPSSSSDSESDSSSSSPPSPSLSPSPLPPGPVATLGDTRPYPFSHPSTRKWSITQPALHDALTTGWHESRAGTDQLDMDADHLASFTLGTLVCSSGLRRWRDAHGRLHEVDWALFRVLDARRQRANVLLGGSAVVPGERASRAGRELTQPVFRREGELLDPLTQTHPSLRAASQRSGGRAAPRRRAYGAQSAFAPERDLFPLGVASESDFPGASVIASGRTSGLAQGTVGPALSLVRFWGRRDFSFSWTVVAPSSSSYSSSSSFTSSSFTSSNESERAASTAAPSSTSSLSSGSKHAGIDTDISAGFGVGGDSGAWILDTRARVVGTVLAERGGVCYFCPMRLVLEDVKRAMGAGNVGLLSDDDALPTLAAAIGPGAGAGAGASMEEVQQEHGGGREQEGGESVMPLRMREGECRPSEVATSPTSREREDEWDARMRKGPRGGMAERVPRSAAGGEAVRRKPVAVRSSGLRGGQQTLAV